MISDVVKLILERTYVKPGSHIRPLPVNLVSISGFFFGVGFRVRLFTKCMNMYGVEATSGDAKLVPVVHLLLTFQPNYTDIKII